LRNDGACIDAGINEMYGASVFDVFRPSAMVRFLALGRAAARYGERVLTHDATLRALQSLRGRVLSGQLAARVIAKDLASTRTSPRAAIPGGMSTRSATTGSTG
jgi:ABC-type transport system involved in cytochrome bd biosynthesis fused ATPase/permease subunit